MRVLWLGFWNILWNKWLNIFFLIGMIILIIAGILAFQDVSLNTYFSLIIVSLMLIAFVCLCDSLSLQDELKKVMDERDKVIAHTERIDDN